MISFDQPDANWHARISFAKSALRIITGLFLIFGNLLGAGIFLILAEILGIAEELV
jgi:hypothetical protein